MKILGIGLIVITIILAVAVLGQSGAITKEPDQSLLSREITLPESRGTDVASLFQNALLNARVPGGIVNVNCNNSSKLNFVASETTSLEMFLIKLEQIDTSYKWQLNDGVLNLLPQKRIPELLELPIKKFNVEKVSAQEALNLLLEKSEVKRRKAELDLDKAVISIHKATAFNPKRIQNSTATFSLNLEGATFRQILNEIVKAQGRATWIYTEKHCGDTNVFSIVLVD